MKTVLVIFISILTFSIGRAQGFIEGNPDGSIWLCETPVNDFTIGQMDEFNLWKADNSLLSPSQYVSTWTFKGEDLLIEYYGPVGEENVNGPIEMKTVTVKCTYAYDNTTKILSIMHFSQLSNRWNYKTGITSSGAFVRLKRSDR